MVDFGPPNKGFTPAFKIHDDSVTRLLVVFGASYTKTKKELTFEQKNSNKKIIHLTNNKTIKEDST